MIAFSATPGQSVSLVIQVSDDDGYRGDGYQAPTVDVVYYPSGSVVSGFPAQMTQITTGVYRYVLVLPTGSTALGTFIALVSWPNPAGTFKSEVFSIHVALPFGNSSVVPA